MKNLSRVKCGWKWLQSTLNEMIDAINARSVGVSTGGGLDFQESQNGVLLTPSNPTGASDSTVSTDSTGSTPTTPGSGSTGDITSPNGQPPTWITTNVVIETSTGYQIKQYYVLAVPV
jgi:hypothetical protein